MTGFLVIRGGVGIQFYLSGQCLVARSGGLLYFEFHIVLSAGNPIDNAHPVYSTDCVWSVYFCLRHCNNSRIGLLKPQIQAVHQADDCFCAAGPSVSFGFVSARPVVVGNSALNFSHFEIRSMGKPPPLSLSHWASISSLSVIGLVRPERNQFRLLPINVCSHSTGLGPKSKASQIQWWISSSLIEILVLKSYHGRFSLRPFHLYTVEGHY